MLRVLYNIHDVDLLGVTNVYSESIEITATRTCRVVAERAFYDDILLFLSGKDCRYYVWAPEGRYTSCVRCEPYEDGLLLTCLETAPEERRKGHALSLLEETLTLLNKQNRLPVYVHIHNRNRASIALHRRLGFAVIADYARLVDGTVSGSYCTMKYEQ